MTSRHGVIDVAVGLSAGVAIAVIGVALYRLAGAGSLAPFIDGAGDWLAAQWQWLFDNLRWSIVPFAAVLVLFLHALGRLREALRTVAPSERVSQADHWVDLWIGTFFGVGVIWTAIGMRNALLAGLGDLDADAAATLGAFAILKELVDGGILLALSTTIVGGIGGYLMRVYKNLRVGAALRRYYAAQWAVRDEALMEVLRRIEDRLGRGAGIQLEPVTDRPADSDPTTKAGEQW